MRLSLWWLAALLGLALGAQPEPGPASSSQADVLLEFAAAARGSNAKALPSWRPGKDPCTWAGVSCSAGGAVTALKLARAGLRGELHPGLARISSLQHIDLAGNALAGRMPAGWARLAGLERLYLDGNALTGPLPPSWNMLDGVKYLSLAHNQLNGSLPAAWSSMGPLYLLELSGNNLTGTLPAAWGRQRELTRLGLARNGLSGTLPREWGALRSLLQLDLGGNALSGPLPAEWAQLQQAASIDLRGNEISGPLPAAWSGMASLQMLALQDNQLSGAVPSNWASLSVRAYRISLGTNPALCGPVPPALQAAVLAAGSSTRGTSLGAPCAWQSDAQALLAFRSAVAAAPPAALADWLPEANPCSQDAWTGVSCRAGRVTALNLTNAGLQLTSLDALGSLTALRSLLLAGNSMAGSVGLPDSWAALSQLAVVDLVSTGVSGSLPPSWDSLTNLQELLLGSNSLNGSLPASWAALGKLTTLKLSQNALTGSLPEEWASMSSLVSLDASANYLTGGLPDSWRQLTSLQELQLANNNLGGAIPPSWSRLPSLALLNLGSNVAVCGEQPGWREGTQVYTDATSIEQSCILVNTSGTLVGALLGVTSAMALVSLAALGALLIFVRRQRVQLQVLQRERSAASFSAMIGGDGSSTKMATLHTFQAGMHHKGPRALTIPNPWAEDADSGYIQVPMTTPHSNKHLAVAAAPAVMPGTRTPPRHVFMPPPLEEHRSPSPVSAIPSPERQQWQVAAQALDRGVDLTARRVRHKRLFRSRSDAAPASAADLSAASAAAAAAAAAAGQEQQRWRQQQQQGQTGPAGQQPAADWSQDSADMDDIMRVHSRIALLPPDGGMV